MRRHPAPLSHSAAVAASPSYPPRSPGASSGAGPSGASSPLLAQVRRAGGTPHQQHRNSSDGVAAILGGGGGGGAQPPGPGRPATREGPRVALPTTPQRAGGGASSTTAAAGGGGKRVEYSCKVLVSGSTGAQAPVVLVAGAGGVQGFRPTMEDCHFELLNHGPHGGEQLSILGVLDGHCGKRVADLASTILPELFLGHPEAGRNNALALVEAVVETDRRIFSTIGRADGGSTLICAVVHRRILTVACLGDARAVLFDSGRAVAMSVDHKPSDPEEVARVRRSGGMVQFGRVMGVLAVSRALGDFEFKFSGNTYPNKEFMVSNVADVVQINITDATKFLILACDGLWDVMSNEEAVGFVNEYLVRNEAEVARDARKALSQCALRLANAALDAGSMDNVSVQILLFHPPDGRKQGAVAGVASGTGGSSVGSSSSSAAAGTTTSSRTLPSVGPSSPSGRSGGGIRSVGRSSGGGAAVAGGGRQHRF